MPNSIVSCVPRIQFGNGDSNRLMSDSTIVKENNFLANTISTKPRDHIYPKDIVYPAENNAFAFVSTLFGIL